MRFDELPEDFFGIIQVNSSLEWFTIGRIAREGFPCGCEEFGERPQHKGPDGKPSEIEIILDMTHMARAYMETGRQIDEALARRDAKTEEEPPCESK